MISHKLIKSNYINNIQIPILTLTTLTIGPIILWLISQTHSITFTLFLHIHVFVFSRHNTTMLPVLKWSLIVFIKWGLIVSIVLIINSLIKTIISIITNRLIIIIIIIIVFYFVYKIVYFQAIIFTLNAVLITT